MRTAWIGIALLTVMACGNDPMTRKQKFLLKANNMIEIRNYDQATDYLHEALGIDSCFADAWNNLGVIATQQGDREKALTLYARAIGCKSDHLSALLNRATTSYELGDARGVLRDVRLIHEIKPDTSVSYFLEGLAYTYEGSFDSAVLAFRRAGEKAPANLETTLNLGTVLYFQGKYEQARNQLEKVLLKNPNDENALNVMALIACAAGDYNEALTLSVKALSLAPANPWFMNNRGYIYLLMGEKTRALEDIDRSIVLDSTNGWAYRNKGLYFYMQRDYASAIRLFERAQEEGGYIERLYLYLGDAYDASGNRAKACEAWEKEKVNPDARQRLLKCR